MTYTSPLFKPSELKEILKDCFRFIGFPEDEDIPDGESYEI